jgi:predicted dehydrogenase
LNLKSIVDAARRSGVRIFFVPHHRWEPGTNSLRCILVPTALDEASAVALDYASALARRFGSELTLLYAFEGSDYAQSSRVEAKLWACFSTIRLRHLKARVFLRPGPTGEQVAAVANALSADLIVTSCDYHDRFLSYLTHAGTGILSDQGMHDLSRLAESRGRFKELDGRRPSLDRDRSPERDHRRFVQARFVLPNRQCLLPNEGGSKFALIP